MKSDRSRSGLLGRVSLRALGWITAAAALAAAVVAVLPSRAQQTPAGYPAAVWVAGSRGLVQLSIADATIRSTIPEAGKLLAVAVDGERGAVWVYGERTLQAFAFDGHRLVAVAAGAAPASGQAADLAVDPADGSVWLVTGKELRRFDPQGVERFAIALPLPCHHLALDPHAGLVWVAGVSRSMWAFDSASGALVRSLEFGGGPPIQDFDLDVGTGELWVAIGDAVRRLTADGEELFGLRFKSPDQLAGLPDGGVWVFTAKELLRLDRVGRILVAVRPGDASLEGFNSPHVSALVASPRDASVWGAVRNVVGHLGPDGGDRYGVHLPAGFDVADLAIYVDATPPSVTIARPTDGAVLSSPEPTIEVRWDDVGSGVDPDTLRLTLDGSEAAFGCTTGEGGATCTAGAPLADGEHVVAATVADREGNVSEPAVVTFTVDTVAPVITLDSPNDGQVTNQSTLPVAGAVSEPADLTLNAQAVTVLEDLTFATEIALVSGANALTLHATDRAGNVGTLSLAVTLDSVPPPAPDPARIAVSAPAAGLVTVTGTPGSVEGGATVVVTAPGVQITTTADADGSFTTSLAASAGQLLQIVAVDLAGNAGPTTSFVVPGGGGPTLPPDPATVAPPVDPTVATDLYEATEFLYTGPNPIQTGVAPGAIEPKRACVLRGRVLDRDGAPLPGVTITVKGHPELGRTLSRLDGMFDLAVNGGGLLTIGYRKNGLLPAQRQVDAPWQDWAWLPNVVLIPQDQQVTAIDLTQPVMQVARGSVISDGDGTRQATLLFAPGTTAELVMPDGSRQPITTLHVRVTEYTVGERGPEAMPAELPANVAYTSCMNFTADEELASGATGVDFSQPLVHYAENFLDFPVGDPVPLGMYDPGLGAWVAAESGRIVRILGVNGGFAELDVDGAGFPADAAKLAALGVTDAERQQLAALYQVGTSLWRTRIPHFSDESWDSNWGFFGGMPPDAWFSGGEPQGCSLCGSIIEAQPQILGESQPVTGTPFSLNYRSNRAPGRPAGRTVTIGLSRGELPAGVKAIRLRITVAGRLFETTFPPVAGQTTVFTWDGVDAYGRPVQGRQEAEIRVGYLYDGSYQRVERFGYSGNGIPITGSFTRREVTVWQVIETHLGFNDTVGQGAGGWTLSPHHLYDPFGRVLYYGSGERRDAGQVNDMLLSGVPGIGARGVAIGANGAIYAADPWASVVRKRAPDGTITVVAGIPGQAGFSGDGGPATQAKLSSPQAVALGADGSLYVADQQNDRIRRVAPDGIITTFAGNGQHDGWHGDGLPATQGVIGLPEDVAVGPDGTVYVAQGKGSRVRRIGTDGLLGTVAGQGWCHESGLYCLGEGFGGDGGPATAALLLGTSGVAVGPDSSIYIADRWNRRVRRVGTDGIITTVAGSGSSTHFGDGGPALFAGFDPQRVAVGSDGALFITDGWAHVIRRVGPGGTITTFAGTPGQGGVVNDVPATQGRFGAPWALAFAPDGDLIVADDSSVRRIHPALAGFTAAELVVPSEDGREVFVFDGDGRHLRTVDALTGSIVYAFAYDTSHRLVAIADANGNVTTIERDGSGDASAIVAPDGQRTVLTMDGRGRLASMTNPAGETHAFTSTPEGLLATMTDPRGNTSTYTYDELGRLVKDEDAAGGFIALSRTETLDHLEVSAATAEGRVTTYTIDRLPTGDESRTVSEGACCAESETVRGTDGSTTTTSRDGTVTYTLEGPDPRFGMNAPIVATSRVRLPSGLLSTTTASRTATLSNPADPFSLTSQTDAVTVNGKTTTTAYSASTRRATTTSPAGRVSTTTLDARGRVIQEQVDALTPVAYGYDGRGRLASVTQGSRTSTLAYDAQGNLASITDPLGHTTGFSYDLAGRVTTQTLPDGRQIGFAYDPAGNVTSITPPGRPGHEFSYTPVDLQQAYTPPDVGIGPTATTYQYDLDKRLTQITRPDSKQVRFAYDATGKLATIAAPHGSTSFSHDPQKGQLVSIVAPDGESLSYSYDGFLETGVRWTGTVSGSIGRTYNSDFRVTETRVNGADPVAYQYDADGLVTKAGDLTITRNATNGLISGTAIGQVTDTRSYNSFGELTAYTAKVGSAPVLSVAYTRDTLGRIAQKVETIQGATTAYDYGYDAAGRLVQVVKTPQGQPAMTTTYAYDSNGNRLSKTEPGGTVTQGSYDGQDRLLTYGDITYAYNSNGDLTSKTQNNATVTYDYDVFGNLRKVVLDSGQVIEYVIDGKNRRVGKKIDGQLVQGFLFDSQLRPIAELDGNNQVVSTFAYGTHVNVPELIIRGGTTYRIVHDHLGSPRLVIDQGSGAIVQRMNYDEWGIVTLDTNPGFQLFGFAGGIHDAQTRLLRFGARDYDAQIGRWTAKDPLNFGAGNGNFYSYSVGDCVNGSDPTGLAVWVCVRRAHILFGAVNHAYLWDDRAEGRACGMGAQRGAPYSPPSEVGPNAGTDACEKVPNTDGREDEIMKCCEENANLGPWRPWGNKKEGHDCFGLIEYCLGEAECPFRFPAGRTGAIPKAKK